MKKEKVAFFDDKSLIKEFTEEFTENVVYHGPETKTFLLCGRIIENGLTINLLTDKVALCREGKWKRRRFSA